MILFKVVCVRCGREGPPEEFLELDSYVTSDDGDVESECSVVCPACTNREEVDLS